MTAADRAARSEHGDGPVLGEDARQAVRAALIAEMGCGDPATTEGRQDLALLGEMADGVLYALRGPVAALLVQARADGAAEERGEPREWFAVALDGKPEEQWLRTNSAERARTMARAHYGRAMIQRGWTQPWQPLDGRS